MSILVGLEPVVEGIQCRPIIQHELQTTSPTLGPLHRSEYALYLRKWGIRGKGGRQTDRRAALGLPPLVDSTARCQWHSIHI